MDDPGLARHGHTISPGTLCPLLHDWRPPASSPAVDDLLEHRRIRRYALTAAGRRELEDSRAALRELAAEVLNP